MYDIESSEPPIELNGLEIYNRAHIFMSAQPLTLAQYFNIVKPSLIYHFWGVKGELLNRIEYE